MMFYAQTRGLSADEAERRFRSALDLRALAGELAPLAEALAGANCVLRQAQDEREVAA